MSAENARSPRPAPLGRILVALLCASCGAKMFDYTPTASLSTKEAKAALLRALEDQPIGFVPTNIEISEERVTFSQVSHGLSGYSVLPVVFYYDSLGHMDLALKRKGYQVRVFDQANVYRFRVIAPSLEAAHRLMDALWVMSRSSSGSTSLDPQGLPGRTNRWQLAPRTAAAAP